MWGNVHACHMWEYKCMSYGGVHMHIMWGSLHAYHVGECACMSCSACICIIGQVIWRIHMHGMWGAHIPVVCVWKCTCIMGLPQCSLHFMFWERVLVTTSIGQQAKGFLCPLLGVQGLQTQAFTGCWGPEFMFSHVQSKEFTDLALIRIFSRKRCHFNLNTSCFLHFFISFHSLDGIVTHLGSCFVQTLRVLAAM